MAIDFGDAAPDEIVSATSAWAFVAPIIAENEKHAKSASHGDE